MIVMVISPTEETTPGSPGGFSEVWEVAKWTHIVIEITEPDPEFGYGSLVARYGADIAEENIYRKGVLVDKYIKESFIEEVSGGIRVHCLREDGWPRPPSGSAVVAIDHDAGGTGDSITALDFGFVADAEDLGADWGLVTEALDQPNQDWGDPLI